MAHPWDRLEGETSKAYAAFCTYRDMGPARSLEKTHNAVYGKNAGNLRQIETWSSKHDWVKRAEAWDDHERAERTKARQAAREKARQKFVDQVGDMIDTLIGIGLGNVDANRDQVRALLESIDRAGVTVPKDLNVTIDDNRRDKLREMARELDDLDEDGLFDYFAAKGSGS